MPDRRPKLTNVDVEQEQHHRKMGVGLSCAGVCWAVLSFLSLVAASVGLYLPHWLDGQIRLAGGRTSPTSIGVFRRCRYPRLDADGRVELVDECGRYETFFDIPSQWWRIGTVTISAGCVLLLFVSVAGIFCCCVQGVLSHTSAKVAGVLQFIAGLCIGAGCVLYPLGWSSTEVRQVCGVNADIFRLGRCTVSWAYYTTIAGCCGAFMCSLLSCHAVRYKGYQRTR